MGSVTLDEPIEDGFGPVAVLARQTGSERGVLTIGPVCIDDRYSACRAGSGIHSHDRNRPQRGRQQQIGKIGLKQFQRFVVGPLLQVRSDFGLEEGLQGVEIGVPDGSFQKGNAGRIGLPDRLVPDHLESLLIVQFDLKGQNTLPDAASQRRHSMKGNPRDLFAKVIETVVFGLFARFPFDDLRNHLPFRGHQSPERSSNRGIIGDPPGHDSQCAFNGFLLCGNTLLLGEILFGESVDGEFPGFLFPQLFGQGLQPFLSGGRCFLAFLSLEGSVEILQPVLVVTGQNLFFQFVGELVLIFNPGQDQPPSLQERPISTVAFRNAANPGLVQVSRSFLAIPGNEGDGRLLFQQVQGGPNLLG